MKTWLRLQLLRKQLVLVVLRRVQPLQKLLQHRQLKLQRKPLKLNNLYIIIYIKAIAIKLWLFLFYALTGSNEKTS